MRRAVKSASAPVNSVNDLLRGGKRSVCCNDAFIDAGQAPVVRLRLGLERLVLGGEPFERRLRVGGKRALAVEISRELLKASAEFADALLGARFLALERVARDEEAL